MVARRWLLVEPYYGGSHRQLVDDLCRRVLADATLWTLPARKWKWRMRGASLEFARRAEKERPQVDGVFCSSMVNAAELRGTWPRGLAVPPFVVYFHENQLTYPVQHFDARDHHFAWTNLHTALAADLVLWNSAHNRDSFLEDLAALARKMPDARPHWAVRTVRARSRVLPVPIDTPAIEAVRARAPRRRGPCHVVWNHRWEFDKGPARLLAAMRALVERDLPFTVSILGQAFRDGPEPFAVLPALLGERLLRFGYVESREEYLLELARADVVLSTADHEFQGLAVLEAAAAGAVPLVPDALAYPEIWPAPWRYRDDRDLVERLVERVVDVERWREVDATSIAAGHGWPALLPRWREVFEGGPGVAPEPPSRSTAG